MWFHLPWSLASRIEEGIATTVYGFVGMPLDVCLVVQGPSGSGAAKLSHSIWGRGRFPNMPALRLMRMRWGLMEVEMSLI